jgi:hypothetical protein
MPSDQMDGSQEPDDDGGLSARRSRADSRSLTGAEEYLRQRLSDPEYAAAYRKARRRLRRPASSHEESTDSRG